MGRYIVAFVLVLFLGFCVFCYHTRTNYNVDNRDREIASLEYERAVLSYALSIVPKETKNEVFFNSVKEKFPDFEQCESIVDLIKTEVEEKKKGDEEIVVVPDVKKERVSIAGAMNVIVGDLTD